MTLHDIKANYDDVRRSDFVGDYLAFKLKLMSEDAPDIVEFHYNLLGDQSNFRLYQILRAAFVERGQSVEPFLLEKLHTEHRPELKLDVIQLLGTLGSIEVLPIVQKLLNSGNEDERYRSCIVLGWIGGNDDLDRISKMLLNDSSAQLRGYAATALRQIWHRLPALKSKILKVLILALAQEMDELAISLIVVSLQTILGKYFGIRENIRQSTLSGSGVAAKERAQKFLSGYQIE